MQNRIRCRVANEDLTGMNERRDLEIYGSRRIKRPAVIAAGTNTGNHPAPLACEFQDWDENEKINVIISLQAGCDQGMEVNILKGRGNVNTK